MKEIRLISLLKSFSREELKSFGKFIESPFSKSTRNIIKLYKYLVTFHPDFDLSGLTKQEIFKNLFEGETYDARKLENLIFDLTKSAEYFLAHQTFEADELDFLLSLSKGYLKKNLYGETKRVIKEIEKKIKPSLSPEKDYISKLKRLTTLKFDCSAKTNDFENIPKCVEDLFEASVIQFMFEYTQFADNMKIIRNGLGKELENEFIKKVLKNINFENFLNLLETTDYLNNPHIGLHYYKFKIVANEDDHDHYNLLKRLLLKNLSVLDREEKWFFFAHLLNYSEQQKLKNVKVFEKESLNIYRSMVENNVYSSSESNYMELLLCRNIILCCYSQKEVKWFEYFLANYTDFLHPEYRDNMKNFGYAHLCYLTGDYEKSLEYNSRINNEFFFFKTDVKNLLLKLYYELDCFDQAFLLIDAYKHFISDSKELPEIFKFHFRTYIKFYAKLIKIKSGESKEDPLMIKEKIEREVHSAFKYWLMEKADELIVTTKSYDKASQSY